LNLFIVKILYTKDDIDSLIVDSYKYHSYFFKYMYPHIEKYSHLKYISLYRNKYIDNINFLNQYIIVKINSDSLINMDDLNFVPISQLYKLKYYFKNLINIKSKVFKS
jgi:hypothetical protein